MGNYEIYDCFVKYQHTLLSEWNIQDEVLNECSGEISLSAYLLLTLFPRHSYGPSITESAWLVEGDLWSSSLIPTLVKQCQLQLVAQGYVQLCFGYLQSWRHHDLCE